MYINSFRYTREQLEQYAERMSAANPDSLLELLIPPGVSIQEVMTWLTLLESKGLRRFYVIVESGDERNPHQLLIHLEPVPKEHRVTLIIEDLDEIEGLDEF